MGIVLRRNKVGLKVYNLVVSSWSGLAEADQRENEYDDDG